MMIPIGIKKLHKANPAFDQPTGKEAVSSKRRLPGFHAIKFQCLNSLSGQVGQVWNACLHSKRHFILADSCRNFWVFSFGKT